MRAVREALAFGPLLTDIGLIERGLAVIGSPEKLARWMQTPVPALGGQTPYSLLESEEGRKQVATVLGRIEHGIY
jgi:putative toxin-antitoxin system antitoxin component (TIGR02293 family)